MNTGSNNNDQEIKTGDSTSSSTILLSQPGAAKTKSNLIQTPSITFPQSGGAIKSIGETFKVNSANGTSSFSIPLPFSPGRDGHTPSVTLDYNSGTGNGIFGTGWDLHWSSIQRRLDQKIPEFLDAEDSDSFLFSGAEDLAPELEKNNQGKWVKKVIPPDNINNIKRTRYRPRTEGLFSRIDKIEEGDNVYWEVRSKQNEVFVFGKSDATKLYSPVPGEGNKIFKWCLEYSYDDKGHFMLYEYKKENKDKILYEVYEENRLNGNAPFTNIYLKSIKYGNQNPWTPGNQLPKDFFFELVFDFGEHNAVNPTTKEDQLWSARKDPYSDFRSGFEIRTYRLCQRVLMFHHFKDELGFDDYLVRSLKFIYDEQAHLCFLERIVSTGYIWNEDGTLRSKKSLPPLEFHYQKPVQADEVKEVDLENLTGDPVGLDEHLYQWVDLFSEGISGILTEQAGGWYYKENLGGGKFAPSALVSSKPSFTGLPDGNLMLQELEANGKKFAVTTGAGAKGYFELTDHDGWQSFYPFESCPTIDFKDPNLKFIDINGDGIPDLLISREQDFIWYAAKGKLGYDDYQQAAKALDEEKGPRIVFANTDERLLIAIADMNGDGLGDILVLSHCEAYYYPNYGYGRFGARVSMKLENHFDLRCKFNPHHIHLADIDGSGSTDIIYTGNNKIQVWYNLSGNSLNGPNDLFNPFPTITDQTNISFVDLLGNGTACLVWSSSIPGHRNAPLKYIELVGEKKPHILNKYVNNMGKEITIEYKPSTYFYLKDKADGKKWITRLPFPIQCVSKVEIKDRISKTRYASEYGYRHGHFDEVEREFRGFGRVEQIDTDTFNNDSLDQFPVRTVTWYHTGAATNKENILTQFEHEYFYNDPDVVKRLTELGISVEEKKIQDIPVDSSLSLTEWRESLRACKGMPLRTEIFSLDGTDKSLFPYSSSQHSCEVIMLQPKDRNKHAVFLVHESESLTYNYERNPADARITHSINVEVDQYGNVLEAVSIAYRRKIDDPDLSSDERKKQKTTYVTYTVNKYTDDATRDDNHRLRLLYETSTFELTRKEPEGFFLTKQDVQSLYTGADKIEYEEIADRLSDQKRMIEQVRTLFLKDDLSGPCKIGELPSKALPYESYQLAFTKTLYEKRFNEPGKNRVDNNLLTTIAKYVNLADAEGQPVNLNKYWIPSGRQEFDASNFYHVIKVIDPYNFETTIDYDVNYNFFVQKTTDALGNVSGIFVKNNKPCFNFRTLAPYVLKDVNDNRTAVRFDELGIVVLNFTMGKEGENAGDFVDTSSSEISVNDKATIKFEYSVDAWYNFLKTLAPDFDPDKDDYKPKPNFVKISMREEHESENANPVWQMSYSYFDGDGKETMRKIQAEPGDAPQRDGNGDLMLNNGKIILIETNPRWVGNGRTLLNNKGKPIRKYEPFFSSLFDFEDEKEMVEQGVSPEIHYDPIGRPIKIVKPHGCFTETQFDSWSQKMYDENDTVEKSQWYNDRIVNPVALIATVEEKDAAQKTILHKDTPTKVYLDSLGRSYLTVADNAGAGKYKTLTDTDIEGNVVSITDAFKNIVIRLEYDMLGNPVYQVSMDAGEKRTLNDVISKNIRIWSDRDGSDFTFNNEYDELHRPKKMLFIKGNATPIHYQEISYGTVANKSFNQCGKPIEQKDTAGIVKNTEFDFKGNLLSSSRQLLKNYRDDANWNNIQPADLEEDVFVSSTDFDALNRVIKIRTPASIAGTIQSTLISPIYNEANLLNALEITRPGAGIADPIIKNINYDAKGQRESITYGNDTITTYKYDPDTFRVINIITRNKDGSITYQDLKYTYDPIGNITLARDDAQQVIYFGNKVVEPKHEYTYDAIYQLIEASGREHSGQNILNESGNNTNARNFPFSNFFQKIPAPTDAVAMRRYTEKFSYDAVGNIKSFEHKGLNPDNSITGFTRNYFYNNNDADRIACNVLGNVTLNNRLLRTQINADIVDYTFDDHGNMKNLPHLSLVTWNFQEQLHATKQTVGGTGETTYYVYDASGQRLRKITERQGTTEKKDERIYLNGFEIYRSYHNNGSQKLQRESLNMMDDKKRIALIETKTIDNGSGDLSPLNKPLIRYQYSDHLGSAVLELDDAAKMISYEEYHPFGTTSYEAIDSSREVPKKRYRYSSMERDDETGFNYHGARYYLPWLARWASSDPSGIAAGINLYCYCLNRPVCLKDLDGKNPFGVQPVTPTPWGPPPPPYMPPPSVPPPTPYVPPPPVTPPPPPVAPPPVATPPPGATPGIFSRIGAALAGAGPILAGVAVGVVIMLIPSNVTTDYTVKYKDPDSGQEITFHDADAMQGYINRRNREKLEAPGASKGTGNVTLPGSPEKKEPLTDPKPKEGPKIAPGQGKPGKKIDAPGANKGSGPVMTSGKVTRQYSGDKVPYTITGNEKAFEQVKKGTSVYVLKDAKGNVLYVGEGNFFDRLRSHIADIDKTQWIGEIAKIEIYGTELSKKESLALEEDLIDELKPKYNKDERPFENAYPGQLRGPDLPSPQPKIDFDLKYGKK